MDTGVNVQVVAPEPREVVASAVERALAWFDTVERICTRFDTESEVMQLVPQAGEVVHVSRLLFESVAFALQLAEQTDGAFDPTVGASLEWMGFNVNYRTGNAVHSEVESGGATFRDVQLDSPARTIRLRRPLVLDLNAVAKGLAIDLAARELQSFANLCVEAGGDVYARGHNVAGDAWRVGIQHPRAEGLLAYTLDVTDSAVCTSGDYERRSSSGESHILDARTGKAISGLASVTVIAPTAMAADGLSTAAMVLGADRGRRFLEEQGVRGVLIDPDGGLRLVNL